MLPTFIGRLLNHLRQHLILQVLFLDAILHTITETPVSTDVFHCKVNCELCLVSVFWRQTLHLLLLVVWLLLYLLPSAAADVQQPPDALVASPLFIKSHNLVSCLLRQFLSTRGHVALDTLQATK